MGGQKHVTSACLSCRRRKVKCDGNDICSNCSTSQLECVYNAEADMRKISAKKVILDLRARVAQLEGVLSENSIEQPPASSPESYEAITAASKEVSSREIRDKPLPSGSTSNESPGDTALRPPRSVSSARSGHGASPVPLTPSSDVVANVFQDSSGPGAGPSDFDLPMNNDNSNSSFMYLGTTGSPPLQSFQNSVPDLDSVADTTDTEGDITDILAARVGALRIAEDGQLRYYGPTSNLHVHPNGFQSLSRSTIRHVETEGLGVLRRLGLDREIPLSIQMHLARLYFAWEDPAIHVVDEDVFFEEKHNAVMHGKSSPYYSETLNNAICAMGANLAGGEGLDLPEPASEFFSARAKALLDIEMDSPTVATVQALVVMSASEAAFTRDARGWLYSGMAARLSADLGLHLDVSKHRSTGLLTDRDVKIRAVAFWGVFVHEHMWSMYVGRPWGMGIRNITAPRPREYIDGSKMWKPYPRAVGQSKVSEAGIPFPLDLITDANISLCEIMRRINTTLYSGRRLDTRALVEFLIHTKHELKAWLESLDPALQFDTSNQDRPCVPAVLQLHMQFYAVMIALYRPYLSTQITRANDEHASSRDQVALSNTAAECVTAAHQVAEILRSYQRQHSLRRTNIQIVHIIFTASLVFIHDVCTRAHHESRPSLNDLQLCCHALGEIGQAYGNATRALEVVILVKSEWQRLAASTQLRGGMKRRSDSMAASHPFYSSAEENERSKRRSRPSVSAGSGTFDQAWYLKPPSFSAFQMLCDDLTTHSVDMTMPVIGENMSSAWPLATGSGFPFGDLTEPMDWPDLNTFAQDKDGLGVGSMMSQDHMNGLDSVRAMTEGGEAGNDVS